jgi:hypothetical protein
MEKMADKKHSKEVWKAVRQASRNWKKDIAKKNEVIEPVEEKIALPRLLAGTSKSMEHVVSTPTPTIGRAISSKPPLPPKSSPIPTPTILHPPQLFRLLEDLLPQ